MMGSPTGNLTVNFSPGFQTGNFNPHRVSADGRQLKAVNSHNFIAEDGSESEQAKLFKGSKYPEFFKGSQPSDFSMPDIEGNSFVSTGVFFPKQDTRNWQLSQGFHHVPGMTR